MIFQKRAEKCIQSNFHIDNEPVIWDHSFPQQVTFHWHLINWKKRPFMPSSVQQTTSIPSEYKFRRNDLSNFDM